MYFFIAFTCVESSLHLHMLSWLDVQEVSFKDLICLSLLEPQLSRDGSPPKWMADLENEDINLLQGEYTHMDFFHCLWHGSSTHQVGIYQTLILVSLTSGKDFKNKFKYWKSCCDCFGWMWYFNIWIPASLWLTNHVV